MDVIFDLDGTLANCEHRLHHLSSQPKNWSEFNAGARNDLLITEMAEVASSLYLYGNNILICTGREESLREDTVEWLDRHGIDHHALYMRPLRDYRDDPIVKQMLYEQMIEDGWRPKLVFEDRSRVVKMWRGLGLICAQVASGDF